MRIEYFTDTDTLLLEFSDNLVAETRDLSENILVEFDAKGQLVSMTIEHASQQVDIKEFIFHPARNSEDSMYKVADKPADYNSKKDKP